MTLLEREKHVITGSCTAIYAVQMFDFLYLCLPNRRQTSLMFIWLEGHKKALCDISLTCFTINHTH